MRKTVALDDLVIDPVVRLYLVDVPAPDLGADRSELRRLFDALAEQWGLTDLDDPPRRPRRAATRRSRPARAR